MKKKTVVKKKPSSTKRTWKGWVVLSKKGQYLAFEKTKANAASWADFDTDRTIKRATLIEDE